LYDSDLWSSQDADDQGFLHLKRLYASNTALAEEQGTGFRKYKYSRGYISEGYLPLLVRQACPRTERRPIVWK